MVVKETAKDPTGPKDISRRECTLSKEIQAIK